jgi:ATP-dependent exoDNAse (exonuclease V) alpha subunit
MTQQEALNILKTGANVFLTGEPGSGKTYTINEYISYLRRAKVNVAVTASTGIAATHLGGMTVHSWSGIGIKRRLSTWDVDRIASTQRIARRIADTHVLIIDEVSMLDGSTLASIERVCRAVKRREEPFGGLQVVLVGDFFQLPPVVENAQKLEFSFVSAVWERSQFVSSYLHEQHRQEDDQFLAILSALRQNTISPEHHRQLNERCFTPAPRILDTLPQLFSHNTDVDRLNEAALGRLPGAAIVFHQKTVGNKSLVVQLRRGCLSPERLALKPGAVVMFTKNSPTGSFVNGTLGTIVDFDRTTRSPIVQLKNNGRKLGTMPMEWTIEEEGRVRAKIIQFPLRLAWAITVHKSQGMSLDAAFMDLRHAFVPGQGYVALSRVRTLAGLWLAGYNEQALRVNKDVAVVDQHFREQSHANVAAFGRLSADELATLHRNFIRAAGGRLPSEADPSSAPRVPYSVPKLREKYPNAYRPWEKSDDTSLAEQFQANKKTREISTTLGRQPGAIRSRLRKLGLIDT